MEWEVTKAATKSADGVAAEPAAGAQPAATISGVLLYDLLAGNGYKHWPLAAHTALRDLVDKGVLQRQHPAAWWQYGSIPGG